MLDFKNLLPEEERYFQFMQEIAEPYLALYRTAGFFSSKDGKKLDKIPFGETERHVEKIIRYRKIYSVLY